MNRIATVVLIVLILLPICSCGKPALTSDEAYKLGKAAVTAADDYLDYKTTKTDTLDSMNEIYQRLGSLPNEQDADSIISLRVSALKLTVAGSGVGGNNDSDVLEARNNLAEYLGMRTR